MLFWFAVAVLAAAVKSGSWVFYVVRKTFEHLSLSEYFLNIRLVEQYSFESCSVAQYRVSPLVIVLIGFECFWQNDGLDVAGCSQVFDANFGGFGLNVVCRAEGCTIFKIVALVAPEFALENVVSVNCWCFANNTLLVIAFKDGFFKLSSCEKFGHVIESFSICI